MSMGEIFCFFTLDLNISQLPSVQWLDLATLFPQSVFKSVLKDIGVGLAAETITRIIFPDTNEFTLSFPAEGEWITHSVC